MLDSCSPGQILSGIISLLNTITTQCNSLGTELLKEELDKLRILRREYLDSCYCGSSIDQDLLSWISVAERGVDSCIKLVEGDVSVADTLQLVRFIVELDRLLGRSADSISEELEEKSVSAKEIKKLYLVGISDLIEKVDDESIRHVLGFLWRGLEPDLRSAVESYAVRKGLVDLALRIEMLREEGLSLESLFTQLVRSELRSLLSEVELALVSRDYGSEVLSRIAGSLKRVITLIDVARSLGFSELKSLDKEFNQLRSLEYLLSFGASMTSGAALKDLKNLLGKVQSFLG